MKYNLSKMMGLDMYLSSLNKSDYESVVSKISNKSRIITPLMSWDVYSQGYLDNLREAQKLQDVAKVKSYAEELSWQNDIDLIFEKAVYEAIIITDINQRIVWVNKGFSKMTGYTKAEVLNKTPRILQGDSTTAASRRNIRAQLKKNRPFREVITNYKKTGVPYKCEVEIFPLHNHNCKTHFMALEKQVV
ncbi:hypothetical protein MHTCC0001_14100 [Flavobacteriaceae bacterium MHTCC 0001]